MKLNRPNNVNDESTDRPNFRRPPLGGEHTQAIAAQMIEHHNAQIQALGDISGALQAMVPTVIGVQTVILDKNGQATVQYRLPFGSLFVDSFSASTLTVTAAPLQSAAPNAGPGIALVRPGGWATLNFRAYQWSIYGGTPGERVTVSAFGRPQAPTAGVGPNSDPDQIVTVPAPGAGNSLSYSLPFAGRLLSFLATYTASATVDTRYPQLVISAAAGAQLAAVSWAGGIVASTSATAVIAIGSVAAPSNQFDSFYPLPNLGVLPAGTVISMPTIDPGDQISAATLLVQASV